MTDSKTMIQKKNNRKKLWLPLESLININKPEKLPTVIFVISEVLELVVSKCVEGASVADLCALGDSEMEKEVKKVFTKNK